LQAQLQSANERAAKYFAQMGKSDTQLAEMAIKLAQFRTLLIEAGRNAGALLADEVSDEFLRYVPQEVRLKIARVTEQSESVKAQDAAGFEDGDALEARRYADGFIEVVNADHDDVISFSRDIGCRIRDHIESLRRQVARAALLNTKTESVTPSGQPGEGENG